MKRFLLFLLFVLVVFQVTAQNPNYVFLFIGDGMGQENLLLSEQFARSSDISFEMMNFPVRVTNGTDSFLKVTTDSAASGTAIACGEKTLNLFLGQTPLGKDLESIAAQAKRTGYKVGIITSIGINHATPAAFYAHTSSRQNYGKIALQMPDSEFDFFAGEEIIGSTEERTKAEQKLKDAGYRVIRGASELNEFNSKGKNFISNPVSAAIGRKDGDNVVSIADSLKLAINTLKDSKGFFIMVEGGRIDVSAHGNEAVPMIHEVLDFEKAIRNALAFLKEHPEDTLIVITADHNTGGLQIKQALSEEQLRLLKTQTVPDATLPAMLEKHLTEAPGTAELFLQKNLGLKNIDEKERIALNAFDPSQKGQSAKYIREALKIRDARCGLTWRGGGHYSNPVFTLAIGAQAERFSNVRENSDIGKILKDTAFTQ